MSQVASSTVLAQHIARHLTTDGDQQTAIPLLSLHRRQQITMPLQCIYRLGLGVVAQGRKQVMFGEALYRYDPAQSLLTTLDVPVTSHVIQASLQHPFLGLMLSLDASLIMQVAAEMALPPPSRQQMFEPLSVEAIPPELMDALVRLVGLLDEPHLIPQLVPLIEREIVVRLLCGAHSVHLRHLVAAGSTTYHIMQAVAWIKQHFAQDLDVSALIAHAHMSPSAFRQHFRQITGMSPLQYQKQLRLQEARQLMLNQQLDASHASALVGYESASQFSREYRRIFGHPPQRDVRLMRQMIS